MAISAPASAEGGSANQWQGIFHSNALNQDVMVRLFLPVDAQPGELRFVNLLCAVGLQPVSSAQTGSSVYNIIPRQDAAAGPYCGIWLGGKVETRPLDLRLQMTVSKGKSKITVNNLVPTSAMR
jgi:hypothetical protein